MIIRLSSNRRSHGGRFFRAGSITLKFRDIYEIIRNGDDIKLDIDEREELLLLGVLRSIDDFSGDTEMLNRIIKNGGLVSYTKKLIREE